MYKCKFEWPGGAHIAVVQTVPLREILSFCSEAHTQFIVITHAKRTMEVAQALYGVTMQEPGLSTLVSVRFDQQQPTPQPQAELATA